jgi:hypothetical protein
VHDILAAGALEGKIPANLQPESGMAIHDGEEGRPPTFVGVLWSVLASMFGVQSNRRREQDFTHGKPSHYIIVGLLVTVMFVLAVWAVVQLVMKLAGL